ncbi:unnamed protein product [Auanema sp. JU1783]|nr:unnamed protein product [Auanema sp. JU1783]
MFFFGKVTAEQPWTRGKVLFISLALRLTIVLYSNIHDYVFNVSFTDVDYHVFTDAARHVNKGGSPYERTTYRYTPVLAFMLLPNLKWADFGKFLFCFFDIIVGYLCFAIMDHFNSFFSESNSKSKKEIHRKDAPKNLENLVEDPHILPVACLWLGNPWIAIISARGSSDAIVCAAVLSSLLLLQKKNWALSAVCHGLCAVHFKIYPLIYLPSIFIHLAEIKKTWGKPEILKALFCNVKGFLYAAISLVGFGLVVLLFNWVYGDIFLEEFLIYHIRRKDVRHNFSPYFLPLYLTQDQPSLSELIGLLAFVPQVLSILYFAFKYYDDLPFCWFLTTFSFVALNKVCTSQYFIWYMVFLPLIVDRLKMNLNEALKLVGLWVFGQAFWLFFAYLFEFRGLPTLEYIFIASQGFLVINFYIIRQIASSYSPSFQNKTKSE